MASLQTNSSAQTALQTLRTAQSNIQNAQNGTSARPAVRSLKESPDFFLPSQTAKGSAANVDSLRGSFAAGSQLQAIGDPQLAGVEEGIYTEEQAEAQLNALSRAYNPDFASRLDANGDGVVELESNAANTDSVLTAEGGIETTTTSFTFYGSQDDIDFLASIGVAATNLGKIGNDTTQDVIEIVDITNTAFGADAPDDYEASVKAGAATAFATQQDLLERAVFSDQNLRAFVQDSDFRAVVGPMVATPLNANAQASAARVDTLIGQANILETLSGAAEGGASSRQTFLADLTDALELGVAALFNTDLDEEGSRAQSFQVQKQLADQGLSIANQRPQTLYSLFR